MKTVKPLKRSEKKFAIRDQARQKIHPSMTSAGADRSYREQVESGRQTLNRLASEGGDPKGKRIKQELTYLLNNYLPSYDMRIEQLIDEWRRTGDPSYDPGIRVRLRQARKEHMSKGHAV